MSQFYGIVKLLWECHTFVGISHLRECHTYENVTLTRVSHFQGNVTFLRECHIFKGLSHFYGNVILLWECHTFVAIILLDEYFQTLWSVGKESREIWDYRDKCVVPVRMHSTGLKRNRKKVHPITQNPLAVQKFQKRSSKLNEGRHR